jgi:hypothetical protein
MTRAINQTEDLSASDLKILTDIGSVGWHVLGVFPQNNESGSDWAFSIGLFHSLSHPEVVLIGLPLKTCMEVVNDIGVQIKAGKRFEAGDDHSDILSDPYRCAFREVHASHYQDYVGYAMWFYESGPFPLLQCFWPDRDGRFPWDADCDETVMSAQPLLYLA